MLQAWYNATKALRNTRDWTDFRCLNSDMTAFQKPHTYRHLQTSSLAVPKVFVVLCCACMSVKERFWKLNVTLWTEEHVRWGWRLSCLRKHLVSIEALPVKTSLQIVREVELQCLNRSVQSHVKPEGHCMSAWVALVKICTHGHCR